MHNRFLGTALIPLTLLTVSCGNRSAEMRLVADDMWEYNCDSMKFRPLPSRLDFANILYDVDNDDSTDTFESNKWYSDEEFIRKIVGGVDHGGHIMSRTMKDHILDMCDPDGAEARSNAREEQRQEEWKQSQTDLTAKIERNESTDPVIVNSVADIPPEGLKLAEGSLTYDDGDILSGVFRVYCPTSQIRPTAYVLRDKNGVVKKEGAWWKESFAPKYKVEFDFAKQVCMQ